MVGRRRDERDARNGVARLGDDVVHLVARQLSPLARLGTLRHLDLYFLGIGQVLRRHAEASRGNLLRLAAKRDALELLVEAFAVLAPFARVAARSQLVHGQRQRLVCLLADGTERHRARHEVAHDVLHRLHLLDGDGVLPEAEEIAQEDGMRLLVGQSGKLLELPVAPQPGGQLQRGNRLGVPGVLFPVLAVAEQSRVGQQ